MPRTAVKSAPAVTEPVVAVAEAHGEPEVFTWDDLPETSALEYVRVSNTGKGPDLEKSTPAFIKGRVEASYELYHATYRSCLAAYPVPAGDVAAAEKVHKRAAGEALKKASLVQRVKTAEQGAEFLKLARKYAAFRGWTLRGEVSEVETPGEAEDDPAVMVPAVVFRTKYREERTRA